MERRLKLRLFLLVAVLFSFFTLIASLAFRKLATNESKNKALAISELVRDTLTSYMVMGVMDRRDEFLNRIREIPGVKSIKVIRGEAVVKQFGAGRTWETAEDDLEKEVLKKGVVLDWLKESVENAEYKVVIPYKAVPTKGIDCLSCHNAQRGEVLGAISLTMDLTHIRNGALSVVLLFALVSGSILLLSALALRRFFNPYLKLIEDASHCMDKALKGDFNCRVETSLRSEGKMLAEKLNKTFDYLNSSLQTIEDRVMAMIGYGVLKTGNTISDTSKIVDELLKIYKFKRVIEKDESKQEVYKRLIDVFREYMSLDKFSLYEVDYEKNRIKALWTEGLDSWCKEIIYENADECRAKRTGVPVDSREFPCICPNFIEEETCNLGKIRYYCIPVYVGGQVGNVFQVVYEPEMEEFIQLLIPYLKGYLNESAPVLEARTYMDMLKEQSIVDALTGLYNRRFLEEIIDNLTAQIKRRGTALGILAIDIDFFKQTNDTHGHDVGDLVLTEVAKTIRSTIRESDIAIRYGGEEFLVLLVDVKPGASVEVAEKIRKAVHDKVIKINGGFVRKTVSVGVSEFPIDSDKIWQCIKFADVALYKAKEEGRNKVVRFIPDMWVMKEY
ncbi:GGDEF domain-containing protein [Thermocrinis sp.]